MSCGVWQVVCKRVLKVGEGIVKDFVCESPNNYFMTGLTLDSTSDGLYIERAPDG